MRLYETTFILNPQADEAALDNQVKSVSNLISENGGKLMAEERMGTRRMTFEIKGHTQGYYTSLLFEAPTEVLPILERHYKLEDPYIRYLTILFEGDPQVVKERQQAMATAMEASERARRESRGHGRQSGGYRRHSNSDSRSSDSRPRPRPDDDRGARESASAKPAGEVAPAPETKPESKPEKKPEAKPTAETKPETQAKPESTPQPKPQPPTENSSEDNEL